MSSSVFSSRLAELVDASTPQQDKPLGYQNLLDYVLTTSSGFPLRSELSALADSILSNNLGIVTARTLLSSFVESLAKVKETTIRIDIGKYTLQALEPRTVSFEDQDARIREILADAHQESEDYVEAAKALQGIQLESSQRKVSDDIKVKTWMRICRLYLEDDDSLMAESYLNRAKTLLYKVEDLELNLVFHLCQARILDSRRKFLEASQAYHNVSLSVKLAEDERNRSLAKAIICAVLAPAGPHRSRALGKLYKDERSAFLGEHGILEKMFLDRIISPSEVSNFAAGLEPHQLAQTADGSTVLAKAVIEHNLLGASRLYNNLGMAELGTLLDLDADRTEEYAGHMLEQGRLGGSIDQIDGVIFFNSYEVGDESRALAGQSWARGVMSWDRNVQGFIEDVERVSSLLQGQLPGFASIEQVH